MIQKPTEYDTNGGTLNKYEYYSANQRGSGRLESTVTNDHNTLEGSLSALIPSDSTFKMV